jgi:hypothetical protein
MPFTPLAEQRIAAAGGTASLSGKPVLKERIDEETFHLLKIMLKANGKQGGRELQVAPQPNSVRVAHVLRVVFGILEPETV